MSQSKELPPRISLPFAPEHIATVEIEEDAPDLEFDLQNGTISAKGQLYKPWTETWDLLLFLAEHNGIAFTGKTLTIKDDVRTINKSTRRSMGASIIGSIGNKFYYLNGHASFVLPIPMGTPPTKNQIPQDSQTELPSEPPLPKRIPTTYSEIYTRVQVEESEIDHHKSGLVVDETEQEGIYSLRYRRKNGRVIDSEQPVLINPNELTLLKILSRLNGEALRFRELFSHTMLRYYNRNETEEEYTSRLDTLNKKVNKFGYEIWIKIDKKRKDVLVGLGPIGKNIENQATDPPKYPRQTSHGGSKL